MSLSRRSSLSRLANRASRNPAPCPTCGARRVVSVCQDVVLRVRGRQYKVEDVPHERCASCGERIFGVDAACRFDALILKRTPGRVA